MAPLVCLVGAGPGEIAMVNRLHRAVGVDLALVLAQPSSLHRLRSTLRSRGPAGLGDAVARRLAERRGRERGEAGRRRWLGDDGCALDAGVPVATVTRPEDPEALRRVASLGGDVELVVHADRIVHEPLLELCAATLNLHWGLSPYYRGTYCTEWALLHGDVRNIGVTIHELAAEVDGGAILAQARAELGADDTVAAIDAQLSALGTELLIALLRRRRAGEPPRGVPQDLARGIETRKALWSRHLDRHVRALERGGLAAMLDAPARPALPIVELDRGDAA